MPSTSRDESLSQRASSVFHFALFLSQQVSAARFLKLSDGDGGEQARAQQFGMVSAPSLGDSFPMIPLHLRAPFRGVTASSTATNTP